MKSIQLIVLLTLSTSGLFGQPSVLEDWSCVAGAAAASSGSSTIITCPQAHGLAVGTYVNIYGATGGWSPLNTMAVADLEIPMSTTDTEMWLQPGTQDFVNFPTPFSMFIQGDGICGSETVTVNSIIDSHRMSITRSVTPSCHAGAGDPEMFGPLSATISWQITAVTSNTFTIALDSSGFGPFAGNLSVRAKGAYLSGGSQPILHSISGDGSKAQELPTSNFTMSYVIPGCTNNADPFVCAYGYSVPTNRYGWHSSNHGMTVSLTVTGGTGVVKMSGSWAPGPESGLGHNLAAGQLCWLWGFAEPYFSNINRPWIVGAVSPDFTTITINNMGTGQGHSAAGVADGTYAAHASWYSTSEFYFPQAADLYIEAIAFSDQTGNTPDQYVYHYNKTTSSLFIPSTHNVLRTYVKWGKTMMQAPLEIGTYLFDPSPGSNGWSNHGYHNVYVDSVPGEWQVIDYPTQVDNFVSGTNPGYWPADPTYNGYTGYSPWNGGVAHYWQAARSFYINAAGQQADFSGQTVELASLLYDALPSDDPTEWLHTRAAMYDSVAGNYKIMFEHAFDTVSAPVYEVRHSTTASIRTGGWSAATGDGTTTSNNLSGGTNMGMKFITGTLPRYSTVWFGIRPTMPVAGVSGNGQSPIWLVMDYDPAMQIGDHITVSGVGGNSAANQTSVAITAVQPRQNWWIHVPGDTTPWTGSGQLVSIVASGGGGSGESCLATTTVAHNLVPGWRIRVIGAWDIAFHRYTVSTVPTATTFQFGCSNVPDGTYNSDLAGTYPLSITAEPGIAISGKGNADWTGGGAIVSTEEYRNFAEVRIQPPSSIKTTSPCDLNGDGVVDSTDVTLASTAYQQKSTCNNLDLKGTCDIVDVQRIINAFMSGVCRVGP